ncbi:MAG: restriction endonuclease [bacterium]
MKIEKISAENVLFIKLGRGGDFEEKCIEEKTLKLGYSEVDHELCKKGDWKKVQKIFLEKKCSLSVATNHMNQIKQFYTADEKTLWITFHANNLWWCFSKPEITICSDGTKTRPVIGEWFNKDTDGKPLSFDRLSGKLLKTQGYRGTICKVEAKDDLIHKINGTQSDKLKNVIDSKSCLENNLIELIKDLSWQDFEILVDLIFRNGGWQRSSTLGDQLKTIDLDLMSPLTGDKIAVQVKSKSDKKEFEQYLENFKNFKDYRRFYYFVHQPENDLCNYPEIPGIKDDITVHLVFEEKISKMVISSGLIDWIINKSA